MFEWPWNRKRKPAAVAGEPAEVRLRRKYHSFRELLDLNTACLEVMADLQEDLQYIPPRRDVVADRVSKIFERAGAIVGELQKLTGYEYEQLERALSHQRNEVERHTAALQELATPRLAASLTEVGLHDAGEVGGKAAYLGEVKNKLKVPVPQGYVLTTEAYRQFCGLPKWEEIRDALQEVDLDKPDTLRATAKHLEEIVLGLPVPRALEVALVDRAAVLRSGDLGLAVRSSAVGEGGEKTFAGQFLSLINVPVDEAVDAYKRVIAGRFCERALSYRVSTGLLEVESPMAVLVLPVIRAKAAGIMYTRDPSNPKSKDLWITATRGLGIDIASGHNPADLFVVSRKRRHELVESHLAPKKEQILLAQGGGLERSQLDAVAAEAPSLTEEELATLASYGVRIESHFKCAQDIEWALDHNGEFWILQTRPLALIEEARTRSRAKPHGEPLLSGGRSIYPGRVSGPAHLAEDAAALKNTPEGAIVFIRRASPEIVRLFPKISGLVAEWGNVAGHAAALLREFKVPSVFLMKGAFEHIQQGDAVSLDAVQARVYPGMLWEGREVEVSESEFYKKTAGDPISQNILTLHLLDPTSHNFRPAGCKSTHDVLRFCHERSVEAMFEINDVAAEQTGQGAKHIKTEVPMNLHVLDLGGGVAADDPDAKEVTPSEIICQPFQSLWRGVRHPGVSWRREMPASLGDVASVMASSFTPQHQTMRDLGMKSYLLVANEYLNFNSRLAYHFTLVDACLSDNPSRNYISFRFAGGGATRYRRNLRACFVEACLQHQGFLVDRRGDLVNAWLKKASREETDMSLDIVGRLLACTSQLDMYMTSRDTMSWYVDQFIAGNYSFRQPEEAPAE
ncbi:MAG: hypothetical protein GY953_18645 [bacterium]|nr:hypothetical protein [bacterium]